MTRGERALQHHQQMFEEYLKDGDRQCFWIYLAGFTEALRHCVAAAESNIQRLEAELDTLLSVIQAAPRYENGGILPCADATKIAVSACYLLLDAIHDICVMTDNILINEK